MRKIIVGMYVTLDGVMEGPGPDEGFEHAGWTMPYFDEEIGQVLGESMSRCDSLLLGRVTYQTFAAAFSSQTEGIAHIMNSLPKYVVSTTLKTAEWNNSKLIKGNVAEEIAKLKQQPGKDILVNGSGTLVQTLIHHDLIDEYALLVYPVVLGTGKRLFRDGSKTLKLIQTKPLRSGVVNLSYQPERK